MNSRLDKVPSLRETPSLIPASRYNSVRLALIRLGRPLRVELKGLRHLDMLLDDEAWVCVDRSLNDFPVVAWTDFQNRRRTSLTDPIRCRLRIFHAHACIIIDTALEAADALVNAYLAAEHGPSAGVSVLKTSPPDMDTR